MSPASQDIVLQYGKKFISLSWDSARKYWNECISAIPAPYRPFVPVNWDSLANLRAYGKYPT